MDDITLQQLEIFIAVAERESLASAAKQLYLDPASVSRWISRLEKALKASLFIRTNHGVELTDDGQFLYLTVKPVLSRITVSMRSVRKVYAITENILRIGCIDSEELMNVLSPIIVRFEEAHPEILVNIEFCHMREMQESLAYGNFDCVVCYSSGVGHYWDIEKKLIHKFDSYFLISGRHPAAAGDELDVSKLQDIDFYRLVPPEMEDAELRSIQICQANGFTPRKINYVPSIEILKLTLKHNNGIAIGGLHTGREAWSDIKCFKAVMPFDAEAMMLAWNKYDVPDNTTKFIEFMDKNF